MAGASIFSGIVRNEDSYTQLLYNLMVRDERLLTAVLAFLLGEIYTGSVSKKDIWITLVQDSIFCELSG